VKHESSISSDISKPDSPSVKRKRIKQELEENGEHPKKQVPADN
jgi:endonuclease-3